MRTSKRRPVLLTRREIRPSCGAVLRDVEPRQDLEPADHRRCVVLRDPVGLLEYAVHAEPDDERVAVRYEVHVARAVVRRLEDDGVDHLDRGCLGEPVGGVEFDDVAVVFGVEAARRHQVGA
jgi:hypothetical protein